MLKASGKTELLDSLLKEFGDSFDPPNMETSKPYKCDFQSLRDKALRAAAGNGEIVAPARAYPE